MNSKTNAIRKICFFISATFLLSDISQTQVSGTVSLGGASFSPTTIGAQNQSSTLNIGVSTSTDVPAGATAVVEVRESTNFNGVSYSVSVDNIVTRRQTVTLSGGGVSTTAKFTFRTSPNNQNGGTIVSQVILISVNGSNKGTPDVISNINLTVNSLQASGCNEFTICGDGSVFNNITCQCDAISPIIIDFSGNGYNLTSFGGGVLFDFDGDGLPEQHAWTSASSDNAFLVLDRNNNGTIDNGQELFGNFTPQPRSSEPNGFLALAEFDKQTKGGNNDGVIDAHDFVFQYLRLWRDINHNGISESNELLSLPEMGFVRINLDYKESRRTDEHGNQFRYRAKVSSRQGSQTGRWAWDVFLASTP